MDTWLKVITAIFLGMMLIGIWPAASHWMKNGPKGTSKQWQNAFLLLAGVVGFVFLLIMMVR